MNEYQIETHLTSLDIGVLVFYFILLISVGFYSMFKYNRSTIKGYFLANRQMTWVCIGASLFATNIGAEHFIGLASSGAAKGLSVGAFEITAIGIIQLLGWIFLPVFIATGVSTLPEYMNRRFGGQRIRIYIACLYLLLYILTKISVNIYASSLFITYAFSWNIYISVLFILILTAICTVSGGLASVMYTDTIQAIIMIFGGIFVMILSYKEIGGLSNLYRRYLNATPMISSNNSIGNLTLLNTCGQPTMKSFQMLRSISDPDMPWLGFLLGHTPNAIWYWCSDQMMVQRVLAAQSLSHARGGTLLAGYLKILPLFMIIIPGMISRTLYPDIVACNQPSLCQSICHSKRSCTNIAYPTLILRILPHGFKGIMLAAMLAALISGLTSIFNSASTIFTVDIYPNLFSFRRKQITTRELMIVGRLFVILMTIFGIIWIPVVIQMQGSEIYVYMQQVIGYFAPPIACIYLLAILWTRANEYGAFSGLMVGFVFGLLRMIFEFSKQPPLCGEMDTRFWFIRRIHFMYYAMFLFWITFFTCVVVSLCTKPPTKEQLFRTTYWTRNQELNVDHIVMDKKIDDTTSILSKSIEFHDMVSTSETHYNPSNSIIEESTSELFLPTTSIDNLDILLINQDFDEDNPHQRRICTTEVDFDDIKQKPLSRSVSTTSNNSNSQQHEKVRCNLFQLLKLCWSWFCGLDDGNSDDYSGSHRTTVQNSDLIEKQETVSIHKKESPIIKWLLNGNLIFILLVEIALFIVFSIPAKYTFLRE